MRGKYHYSIRNFLLIAGIIFLAILIFQIFLIVDMQGKLDQLANGSNGFKLTHPKFMLILNISMILLPVYFGYRLFKFFVQFNKYNRLGEKIAAGLDLSQEDEKVLLGENRSGYFTFLKDFNGRKKVLEEVIRNIEKGKFENLERDFSDEDNFKGMVGSASDKLAEIFAGIENRSWHNEGINRLSSILRASSDDLDSTSDQFIRELTKYLKANQSSFYITVDEGEEKYLDLKSCYAWDRKKHHEQTFSIYEGLIGQVYHEREVLVMTEIPEGYMTITSGLGEANPTCVVIQPVIHNENVEGIIEIAFFKKVDEKQLSFLSEFSKLLGSHLSFSNNNKQTRKLLEESQVMTRQLMEQEMELKEKSEELMHSHDQLNIKLEEARSEMRQQLNDIEEERQKNLAILEGCEDGVVIFNEKGKVKFFNRSAEEIWGYERNEILNKHLTSLMPAEIIFDNREPLIYYTGQGKFQQISVRTEVTIQNKEKEEISVLMTQSSGKVKGKSTFAFFVQRISVELF